MPESPTGWTTPRILLPWVVAALAVAPVALWLAGFGPDVTADDWAQYVMHAQALVDGRGYGDIPYIYSPYAWGAGPPLGAPGLPLLLAPAVAAVGFQPWMHWALSTLSLALFAVVSYRYLAQDNREWASWAVVLTVAALVLAGATRTLTPDLPFCAALWATFLLADHKHPWPWWRHGAVILAGVGAIVLRGAALPLIPALLLFGLVSWKKARMGPVFAAAACGVAALVVYGLMGAARIPPVPEYVVFPPRTGTPPFVQTLIRSLSRYRLGVFELELYPFPSGRLNDVYHLVVTPILGVGVLRWLWGHWRRLAAIWAVGYVAFLLLVGVAATRYLWPLWPIAAYGFVWGLAELVRWIARKRGRAAGVPSRTQWVVPGILAGVIVSACALQLVRPPAPSLSTYEDFQGVAAFVRGLEPRTPDVRVSFFSARTMAYHTGVPTMPLASAPTTPTALEELGIQAITHLVVGAIEQPGLEDLSETWAQIVAETPGRFLEVYRNDAFVVYEVS